MISQSEKTNPISEMAKMNANIFITKDYENETTHRPKKTNPIQTQSNPISKQLQGRLG